jgi:hypothetical protein
MSLKSKKKAYYQRLIDKVDEGRWSAELRINVLKKIREGIRREFDRICEAIKGIDEEITRQKDQKQLAELNDAKSKLQLDADKMREQMLGKFVESEGEYHGGLDEEIKSITMKVEGGEEFKKVVEEELKKL